MRYVEMRRYIAAALVVFALLIDAAPLLAAKRVGEGSTLRVNVRERRITDTASKEVTGLVDAKSGKNEFELRSDDKIIIAIEDYNPLLFTYEFKADTPTDTEDFKAALEFAKVLAGLASRLSLTALPRATTIGGLNPVALRLKLAEIAELVERIPELLALSKGTPAEIAQLKKILEDKQIEVSAKFVEKSLEQTHTLIRGCMDKGVVTTDQGETVDCNEPLAFIFSSSRQAAVKKLADANAAVAQAKAQADAASQFLNDVTTPPVADPPAALKAAIAAAGTRKTAADTNLKNAENTKTAAAGELAALRTSEGTQTLLQFLQSVTATEFAIREELRLLRKFAEDVSKVGELKILATTPYSIKNQPGVLTVKANPTYEALMDAATRAARSQQIGEYPFELRPYQPARLRVGGAAVAGMFIKNPKFKAVKDGDAFAIKREDDDPVIFKVAAMLNITPRSWAEPTFGGYFQLGVTPDPDEVGFYFGTGIRAQTVFSFGGGLMIQQVRKLGEGLTLETRLDDPAKLKTDSEFKPGLYFHFTVALPK
jgi:hypothetical protein